MNNTMTLMQALNRRTDLLLFVTGPTGCGKSTIVSNLSHFMGISPVHPGRAFRGNPGLLAKIKDSDNPTAPKATETAVRTLIKNRVIANHGIPTAVDGFPRSVAQVEFCVELAMNYERDLVFAYVNVSLEARVKRLSTRNQEGDDQILAAKLKADESLLPPVLDRIREVCVVGKFGSFYEIYNRRDSDLLPYGGEAYGAQRYSV